MNLSLKEQRIVLNWFDIAVECGTLGDIDLKLYDKMRESVEDEDDLSDPLVYNPSPKKKSNRNEENFDDLEEGSRYGVSEYTGEDKY